MEYSYLSPQYLYGYRLKTIFLLLLQSSGLTDELSGSERSAKRAVEESGGAGARKPRFTPFFV